MKYGFALPRGPWHDPCAGVFLTGITFSNRGVPPTAQRVGKYPPSPPKVDGNVARYKRLIFILLGVTLTLSLIASGAVTWIFFQARQSNVGELSFTNPLRVPEILEPTIDDQGRKVFDLTFTPGQVEFIEGRTTDTWGLNGPYLSPTLRASRGDDVVVNVTNGLDEVTSLHWHGMHLPAEMDGGPHQEIAPGETWSPEWTIDQPAAALWFHPHPHGATAEHVYRGAAGMFLIDDPEADALELPDAYGVDDVPLIIQDKKFRRDGSLDFTHPLFSSVGLLGDEILVNGTHDPYFEATTSLLRFRVLNGSNARLYNLGFSDDRDYTLVGTDAGLLEAPVELDRLLLSPGERAEIVVELEPGDDVTLRSHAPDVDGLNSWEQRIHGGLDTFDLVNIRASDDLVDSDPLPAQLVDIDRPEEAEAVKTRTFDLGGTGWINGEPMDMNRIDFAVTEDTTEIWEISASGGGIYHNFHPHLVHFAVLDIDGEEPAAHLRGWKDTVFIAPGRKVRIIARFGNHTDTEFPYMYHCHVLFHEDNGMMGQFVVIEPGAEPPTSVSGEHDH